MSFIANCNKTMLVWICSEKTVQVKENKARMEMTVNECQVKTLQYMYEPLGPVSLHSR